MIDKPYQVMPEPTSWDEDRLRHSMRTNGYLPGSEIVVDEVGAIVDGYTRDRISLEVLGVPAPRKQICFPDETAKLDYAHYVNHARRHLSPKQRRDAIRELVIRHPEWSNTVIASATGVSHPTVGAVRRDLEDSGEVEHIQHPNANAPETLAARKKEAEDWASSLGDSNPRTPISEANHRGDLEVEVLIHYAGPADEVRQHGGAIHVREKEPRTWRPNQPIVLACKPPKTREDWAELCKQLTNRIYKAGIEKPLLTMDAEAASWR